MAKLYRTEGKVETVKPAKGKRFTLKEVQAAVGGYVEILPTTARIPLGKSGKHDTIIYLNEEARIHDLPFNLKASDYARTALYGDVLVCEKSEALT